LGTYDGFGGANSTVLARASAFWRKRGYKGDFEMRNKYGM
jgi:hypothetical protein